MNYTFTTDDKDEATMLLNAPEAWAMLSDTRQSIRNFLKHGEDADLRESVECLYREICITLSRIEQ
jgi:hypothetical protein